MLHIGLQVKDKDEFDKLQDLLKDHLGILPALEFDNSKSGIYFMSTEPIDIKTLDDFHDEDIRSEFLYRGL